MNLYPPGWGSKALPEESGKRASGSWLISRSICRLPIVRSPNFERLAGGETPSVGKDRRRQGQASARTNDLARVFGPLHETAGPHVEKFSDFKDAVYPRAIPMDGQAGVTTR